MRKRKKTLVPAGNIEPHVYTYSMAKTDQSRFILPFQLMSYLLLVLLVMAFYGWMALGNHQITTVVVWMHLIFAPFYIPGVYHYYRFLKREEFKQVEVDARQRYIHYHNARTHENFLFHADQIVGCQYYRTVLFPYNIDYVKLSLEGGREVCLSSLVVDPGELLADLEIKHEVQQRLFNSMPR